MQSALERVLHCPNLPSLPAVAMKVLELTRDPGVSIARIAQTVQNDPALTSKVLRTVNSSYYGLATPCPSISRAMSLLGLNTVKSIVLGFSLVDCTKKLAAEGSFDLEQYWRRAIYSAVGARAVGMVCGGCDPEEAFTGSLLQDIGMLATFAALRGEYVDVLSRAPTDHDQLAQHEKTALGFDHTDVGQQLGEQWRLPLQIVECIARHHAPDLAPAQHEKLVRTVGLGGLIAGALSPTESQRKINAFIVTARKWMGMEIATAKDLVDQTAKGAAELSKMLELKTGARPDVAAILSEAHELMAETQEAIQRESIQLKRSNDELARKTITDGLTGAFNRAHFDATLRMQAAKCKGSGHPISVIFLDADRFKSVNDTHGHQAGDAVLMELSKRIREVGSRIGTVCRYGGEEFVLILPQVGLDKAVKVGELLRQCVGRTPFDLAKYDIPSLSLNISISVGVASCEPGGHTADWTPEQIVHAADEAVYAAKKAGRNCVRFMKPSPGPAATRSQWTLLVVEDDPFARRVLAAQLKNRKDILATIVESVQAAMDALATGPRPNALLTDMNFTQGSGTELCRSARAKFPDLPVAIMSGAVDDATTKAALDAGASLVLDKVEFTATPGEALDKLADLVAGVHKLPPAAAA